MINKKIVSITLIAVLMAIGLGIYVWYFKSNNYWICEDGHWMKHGNPTEAQPKTRCQSGEIIKTKADFEADANKPKGEYLGITIMTPNLNATTSSPMKISGSAKAEIWQDKKINFKVVDSNDKLLGQLDATQKDTDKNGDYQFNDDLVFDQPSTKSGFIVINNEYKFQISF